MKSLDKKEYEKTLKCWEAAAEIFIWDKKRGFREINLMVANIPHLAKFISSFNPSIIPYFSVMKKRSLQKL